MESGCVGGDIAIGYVVGFIDAEASFSVSIKYQRGYGLRLDPVFSITQLNREPLDVIHGVINAGRIIKKPEAFDIGIRTFTHKPQVTKKKNTR